MATASRVVRSTRRRVRRNTAESINRRIDDQIERNVRYFSVHKDGIGQRLNELSQEWDIERMLQTNAAALALTGTLLGVMHERRYLMLPMAVAGFLLQHAIQGWCPPIPILRRFGFRTADEINRERYALKALRGDFDTVGDKKTPTTSANAALKAVGA
ncbi:MAG: hypothetical protein ACRECO_13680 [Xanthobacteraceae bacterium]